MDEKLEQRRHSAAHVLAMAVLRLFPDAKLGVGPVTREGFYHDIETTQRLRWDDVKRIEAEMNLIIEEGLPFKQVMTSHEEAFQLLLTRGQIYKSELLQQIGDARVSFFQTGDEFIDLCRGPHMVSTGQIGAIKLLSISDVHWKNDPSRPLMQRITGVAFATNEELNNYVAKLEAIQSRDFIKLAQDMEMIIPESKISYTPAGSIAINAISDNMEDFLRGNEFEEVLSFEQQDQQLILEDLHRNYRLKNRSYRSLPLRLYSINRMRPNEAKDIHGKKLNNYILLSGISYFPEAALESELESISSMLAELLQRLDIKAELVMHTSDLSAPLAKYTSQLWKNLNISQTHVIDATAPDDGIMLQLVTHDSLEREWNILSLAVRPSSTEHVNTEGEFSQNYEIEFRIVVERIFAYYLEEHEGDLPYWACPTQAVIIPISEGQVKFAEKVEGLLRQTGLRSRVDSRAETMQARIREAELDSVPLIIIIGEKEENADAVSLRMRDKQEVGMLSTTELAANVISYLERS